MRQGVKPGVPRRKAANRRRSTPRKRKQQQLLEVRARARMAKQQRNRWAFTVFCRLFLLLAVLGGVYYGGYTLLQQLFFANEEYTLKRLDVEVEGTISREKVLSVAGLRTGVNIFSVSLDSVRERLEEEPQILSAEVERHLPDRMVLRVAEREPIAWVTAGVLGADPYTSPDSYLVDSRGILMQFERLHPEFLHLPIITGVPEETMVAGGAMESYALKAALDLIVFNATRISGPPFEIRSVDLSKGYCMQVTDARHAQYVFPLEDLERRMRKLELLLEHAATIGREIEHVNLVPSRNVPVRFVRNAPESGGATGGEASAAPPVRRALPVTP